MNRKPRQQKVSYENSFGYYLENELGLNIDNIWNWEKNRENGIESPFDISKGSEKKVWLFCQLCDYHNYDINGNKIGYEKVCKHFNNNCNYCNKNGGKVHYKDSLGYLYPQIAEMIAIEENGLIFEDTYFISPNSHKKYHFKCFDCETLCDKKEVRRLIKKHYCPCCSDGIPITEKFIANILEQLNINFIIQLNKTHFKWCDKYKYDFYLEDYNMIIECNGIQHYEQSNRGKRSLLEEQLNDDFKEKRAKYFGVENYIVIDMRYSTFEWLKENTIKSLSNYFDLFGVDWDLIWEKSQHSLCVKSWELWNNGYDVVEISELLKIHRKTIVDYLKLGAKLDKCNYSKEVSYKKGLMKRRKK